MTAWKSLAILGLAFTLVGALLAAWRALPSSTAITASSYEDFSTKQRRMMTWLRIGLGMIAVGTALQIIAVLVAP